MTLPTVGATGQRQPVAVQDKVAACSTAPVAPSTDFTDINSNINQREFSGKQDGAFAISKNTTSGNLTLMMATGMERDSTWIPITRASTLTPTIPAPLSVSTDLSATLSVTQGDDLTLTLTVAGGVAPYTHTWYKDGADVYTTTSGVTSTYTKAATDTSDAGTYHAVVTDSLGASVESTHCAVTIETA